MARTRVYVCMYAHVCSLCRYVSLCSLGMYVPMCVHCLCMYLGVRSLSMYIQGVSRLVDITAGGDFLGLCDQKSSLNMCQILDGYKRNKIINQLNT
jgi:hypothetical protein